jgi:hypothetical protein
MIRDGTYLLCQLFFGFIWFIWSELGGFWRVEGVDKKTGNREQGRTGNGKGKSKGPGLKPFHSGGSFVGLKPPRSFRKATAKATTEILAAPE